MVDPQGKMKLKRFVQTPQPNPAVVGLLQQQQQQQNYYCYCCC